MNDNIVSFVGGVLLGIWNTIRRFVGPIFFSQILPDHYLNTELNAKIVTTLLLGIVGGFGGLVGKAVFLAAKKGLFNKLKGASIMRKGILIPSLVSLLIGLVLFIAIQHEANHLAFEYNSAGLFWHISTWSLVCIGFAWPFLSRFVRVRNARYLTITYVLITTLIWLLILLSAIGFNGFEPNNPF